MSIILDVSVTIACGPRARAVTPEALARELGLATVRPALLALLLRPIDPQSVPIGSSPPGEPTEGERSFDPIARSNAGTQEYFLDPNDRSIPERQGEVSRDPRALAARLVNELGDPPGRNWYEIVASTLDHGLVTDALERTLRVPDARLRRSRAAYFTSIVAPLVRSARSSQSYAPTPAPS